MEAELTRLEMTLKNVFKMIIYIDGVTLCEPQKSGNQGKF